MASAYNISRILLLVVLASSAYAITDCTTISVPGAYVLENSITDTAALLCINISVSNVALNGAGFTVDGADAATSKGIYAYNSSQTLNNITIGNLSVTDFSTGINLVSIQNSSVLDSTVASNAREGLVVNYSVGITVSGVHSENNTASGASFDSGIHFMNVNSSSLSNSVTLGNSPKYNVVVWPGNDINITNNTAVSTPRCFYLITINRAVVSYNNMSNCTTDGIDFFGASNFTVYGNNISNCSSLGMMSQSGSQSLFYGNIVKHGGGIKILASTSNTYENNTVYNITGSCFASGQPGSTLDTYRNNLAYNCTLYGFNVTNVTNSVYENNVAYGNLGSGFYLGRAAANVTILNNTAYNNTNYGFYIISSGHNLTGNTAYNNSVSGIRLSSVENNTVADNIAYKQPDGECIDVISSNRNNLTGNTAYNCWVGIYLQSGSNNTLANNTAYNNSYPSQAGYGFSLITNAIDNVLIDNTAYNNSGYGFAMESGSSRNTLTDCIAYNNSQHGAYMTSDSVDNVLANAFIYGQPFYILQQATAASSNNFTNVTLGYNSTMGLLNYQLLNVTALDLNYTNLKLDPYFVSLDDSTAGQANLSANITIYTGSCAYSIFSKAGFPATRGDITVNGSVYSPLSRSCSGNTLVFDVGGFTGYSAGSECVNISDTTSWRGVINSSGVLYVNANTTLCTGTYYINAAAGTAALQMNSSGIHLNCNQSTIDGVDANGYGVYLNAKENNTVENCTVRNFQHGIYMTSTVRYNRLAFNTAFNNSQNGIYMITNVNYNTFINNTVINNTLRGFYIRTSFSNTFTNNTAINSGFGFSLSQQTAYNNTFTGNTAHDNANSGFYMFASSNNSFIANSVYNNTQHGFHGQSFSMNSTFENNTVSYNLLSGFQMESDSGANEFMNNTVYNNTEYGFNLQNHTGSVLINNTIYLQNGTNDAAVYGDNATNATIYGNSIYDNYYGVFLMNSLNMNVSNNTLLRHGKEALMLNYNVNDSWIMGNFANITSGPDRSQCIQYGSSNNGLISNNRLYGCYHGIYLGTGSTNTTVSNNTVDSVSFRALILSNVHNNTVIGNTLVGNSSDILVSPDTETDCDNIITGNTGSGGKQIFYSNESVSLSGGDYSQIFLCGANDSTIENIYMPGDSPTRKNGITVYMSENVSASNITVGYANVGFEAGYYSNGITVEYASFENNNYAGLWIFYLNDSVFRDINISGVEMQDYAAGIWLDGVNNSAFSGIRISESNPPAIYAKNSTNNTISNSTLFNTEKYLLHENDTAPWNVFNAFTLCKGDPSSDQAGCIEFDHLNISFANLTNNTNIRLADDFVSINTSDTNASQFNSSANITLTADCSPGIIYNIYRKEAFSSSAADILANGTLYVPTRMSCANDYLTFGVTSFSGYALEEGTLNLTISPSTDVLPHVQTTASCDSSNPSVMLELYRNGELVANGTSHIEDAANLTAGTYNYVCNTTNYSSAYATGTLRVRAANEGGSSSPLSIRMEGEEVVGSTITITVRDGSTPVSGAEVRILYWTNGILNAINLGNTNSDGEVSFTPTLAGEYRIEATESGYSGGELLFTVEAAEEEVVPPAEEPELPTGEPSSGTEPSGTPSGGSTGGQPSGGTQQPATGSQPECTVDSDCSSGFECQVGACVETAGQPTAEGEESPAVGATPVQQAQPQGVPWWAWLLILIVLGGGAYWYFGMRKK